MKAKVRGNLFLEEHFCGKECAFRQKQPEGGDGQFLGWDSEKRGIHLMCCFLFICDFYQSVKHLWRPKQDQTSELGVGGEGDREETPWPLHSRHSACWVEGPPQLPSPLGTRAGWVRSASWSAALFVEALTFPNRSKIMIMALFALCGIKLSQ